MTKSRFGDQNKMEIMCRVHKLGFNILTFPEPLLYKAAEFKAEYPISYADCFALACALEHSAILVTGDPEFKKVVHLVSIEWIR